MAMSENTRKIWDYLKANDGKDHTAEDIGNALGLSRKSVDCTVTSAFITRGKNLVERVPAEVELPDGTHKGVKLIVLTDKGRAYDPDAVAETTAD